jgi:hypothetical protein
MRGLLKDCENLDSPGPHPIPPARSGPSAHKPCLSKVSLDCLVEEKFKCGARTNRVENCYGSSRNADVVEN